MQIKFDHVFQFKVTLKEIKPPVWRRIAVPCDCTFWDLHVAIQDAFGWLGYHLHEFTVRQTALRMNLRIGIPDGEGFDEDDFVLPGWAILVAHHITLANRKVSYAYDFGDDWQHDVYLEKIVPREKDAEYPQCLGGRRACPPEDCGGLPGYEDLLAVLADPRHEEYASLLAWVGGGYDPEAFDKDEIEFSDPDEMLDLALGEEPEEAGPPELRVIPGRMDHPDGKGRGQGRGNAVDDLSPDMERLRAEADAGYRGFPVATVALYGPDDKRATKIAVGIVETEGADVGLLERWTVDEGDIRGNVVVASEILAFIGKHGARTVAMSGGIMGCPHEEGVDYPDGGVCPQCSFWAGRDGWTGGPVQ